MHFSLFLWDDELPSMAAPPSLIAISFPFILLLSLSLLLLLFLFLRLRTKRRRHPPPGCRDRERLGLRSAVPQPQPPPRGGGDGGGKKGEEAAAAASGGEESAGGEDKVRRKRARKKGVEYRGGSEGANEATDAAAAVDRGGVRDVGGGKMECIYPFSSFASATQRKIKLQYDEIVKSNKAKTLTMAQVGQFVNCLVDARKELERKSDVIQRSFKIKRALLCTANKSSFDRLCQQIYKLEVEHKRLEEDASVYNLLQEQLKLSPAYKTMLEVTANMEQNADSDQAMGFPDISFEELLAQEKKDLFWQRNRKLR